MRAWIVLMFIGVALAGCGDDAPPASSQDEETFEDLGGRATATTGLIRGIVLDPSIVPIEGATITLLSSGAETETNEDGAFLFDELEPGTYFLEVSKVGYNSTQSSSTVEAGVEQPPIVKVQLIPNPGSEPFYESIQTKGYHTCATAAFTACNFLDGTLCGADQCDLLLDSTIMNIPIQQQATWINTEEVWESTQLLGQNFDFYLEKISKENGDWSHIRSVEGGSPLLITVDEAEALEHGFGSTNDLRHRTFPMLDPTTLIIVDQGFEVFTHVFYNYQPYEGWRITEDGNVPAPPS